MAKRNTGKGFARNKAGKAGRSAAARGRSVGGGGMGGGGAGG